MYIFVFTIRMGTFFYIMIRTNIFLKLVNFLYIYKIIFFSLLDIEKSKINLCWLERTSFRTYLCWKPRIIYNHLLFCLGQAAPVRLWFLFTASTRRRRRISRCQLWRRLRPAAALPAVVLPVRVPVHGRRGSGPHGHIVRGLAARACRHAAGERIRRKFLSPFLWKSYSAANILGVKIGEGIFLRRFSQLLFAFYLAALQGYNLDRQTFMYIIIKQWCLIVKYSIFLECGH